MNNYLKNTLLLLLAFAGITSFTPPINSLIPFVGTSTVNAEENGSNVVTVALTNSSKPIAFYGAKKQTSKTLYLGDGYVYSANHQSSLFYLFSIKKSDGDNVSKLVLTIEYDDMSVEPATSKTCVKDLTLKDGFYILDGKLFNSDRMRIKAVKLKFERTGSSEIVYTSSFGTGEIIQPGQTAFLTVYHQESMPQYHYKTNDFINHPTNRNLVYFAAHLDDVTFESAGFGDGRIINAPTGTGYSYEYYLTDHLGSTRMVINNEETVTEALHYQPYGTVEPLPNYYNSALPVREKFTTKEFDEDGATDGENGAPGIGLFYFGARYYDAEVGRWISVDPRHQHYDAFLYGSNNPINRFDPDGGQDFQTGLNLVFPQKMQDASVNYVANTLPEQAAVAGAIAGVGVAVYTAPTWVPPVVAAATTTAAKYGPEIMATAKMIETIGSPGPAQIDDAPRLVAKAPLSHPDFIGSIIGGIQEKWSDIKSFFSGSSIEKN